MISWDHFYIESLKLLFLGIFISPLCLRFLYFSFMLRSVLKLTLVLHFTYRNKGDGHRYGVGTACCHRNP